MFVVYAGYYPACCLLFGATPPELFSFFLAYVIFFALSFEIYRFWQFKAVLLRRIFVRQGENQ